MRNILQQDGLAGTRRRDDQRTLAFADRCHDINDAGREVLFGRILVFHLEAFVGIEGGQIVEIDLVPRLLGILEIDWFDLEQGEITLAFFRRADMAFNSIAGAQTETANLAWWNVVIVRPGQVILFPRAEASRGVREP